MTRTSITHIIASLRQLVVTTRLGVSLATRKKQSVRTVRNLEVLGVYQLGRKNASMLTRQQQQQYQQSAGRRSSTGIFLLHIFILQDLSCYTCTSIPFSIY